MGEKVIGPTRRKAWFKRRQRHSRSPSRLYKAAALRSVEGKVAGRCRQRKAYQGLTSELCVTPISLTLGEISHRYGLLSGS